MHRALERCQQYNNLCAVFALVVSLPAASMIQLPVANLPIMIISPLGALAFSLCSKLEVTLLHLTTFDKMCSKKAECVLSVLKPTGCSMQSARLPLGHKTPAVVL